MEVDEEDSVEDSTLLVHQHDFCYERGKWLAGVTAGNSETSHNIITQGLTSHTIQKHSSQDSCHGYLVGNQFGSWDSWPTVLMWSLERNLPVCLYETVGRVRPILASTEPRGFKDVF
jgi:hypothetical protein